MKVTPRDATKTVAPGADFSWPVTLTNGSTQSRELLSIEMPHQARAVFTLVGRQASYAKPIKLASGGGTHTQQFKFNARAAGSTQGTFKATLLFNFTNWVLEHTLTVVIYWPL